MRSLILRTDWKEAARLFFSERAKDVVETPSVDDLCWIAGRDPRLWRDISLFEEMIESILSQLDVSPAHRLLEVGCASGFLARGLAPRCREYVGVDLAAPTLEVARRLGLPNATFLCEDATALRLPDASFDRVVSYDVFTNFARLRGRRGGRSGDLAGAATGWARDGGVDSRCRKDGGGRCASERPWRRAHEAPRSAPARPGGPGTSALLAATRRRVISADRATDLLLRVQHFPVREARRAARCSDAASCRSIAATRTTAAASTWSTKSRHEACALRRGRRRRVEPRLRGLVRGLAVPSARVGGDRDSAAGVSSRAASRWRVAPARSLA